MSHKSNRPSVLESMAAGELLMESRKNTPDWFDLKRAFKDEFLVFVTGNQRRNYWREAEMDGCNYYGLGITYDENFVMQRSVFYGTQKAPDPLVFEFPTDTDWKQIDHVFDVNDLKGVEGEVYGVPLRFLAKMDVAEQNGEGVTRIERYVTLLHPMQEKKQVRCFMYVVDIDYFMDYYSHSSQLFLCNSVGYPTPFGRSKDVYYAPVIK